MNKINKLIEVAISFVITVVIVGSVVGGLMSYSAAANAEQTSQEIFYQKCTNAFIENDRLNDPNGENYTYLRDVWKNADLDPQACREVTGNPDGYNEYR